MLPERHSAHRRCDTDTLPRQARLSRSAIHLTLSACRQHCWWGLSTAVWADSVALARMQLQSAVTRTRLLGLYGPHHHAVPDGPHVVRPSHCVRHACARLVWSQPISPITRGARMRAACRDSYATCRGRPRVQIARSFQSRLRESVHTLRIRTPRVAGPLAARSIQRRRVRAQVHSGQRTLKSTFAGLRSPWMHFLSCM